MKKLIYLFLFVLIAPKASTQIVSSNTSVVSLEHNILFNAENRYTVTQTGSAIVTLPALFDGFFVASYTTNAVSEANPTVILIEGLPNVHRQLGAWVGWTTRYWPMKKFKIEGYDQYNNANKWVLIDSVGNNSAKSYNKLVPSGAFTKIKLTIYQSTETSGKFGISELYFLHPEATRPYSGMLPANMYNVGNFAGIGTKKPVSLLDLAGSTPLFIHSSADSLKGAFSLYERLRFGGGSSNYIFATNESTGRTNQYWNATAAGTASKYLVSSEAAGRITFSPKDNLFKISYAPAGIAGQTVVWNDYFTLLNDGRIGIGGLPNANYKVAIHGVLGVDTIKTHKISVRQNIWADYVFSATYKLPSIADQEIHILNHHRLLDVPSAKEIEKNGIDIGDMNRILLQKIEEQMLYIIELNKRISELEKKNSKVKKNLQ